MPLRKLLLRALGGNRPVSAGSLPVLGKPPDFSGLTGWINADPLDWAALRGKVVLVDFWTFSCINCLRTLPHIKAWQQAYVDAGLAIVGVHTPEFSFEHGVEAVKSAVRRLEISYPVGVDDNYSVWNAYRNRCWPAHYFIDGEGRLRYRHFGEGAYEHSESVIRSLLEEKGSAIASEPVSQGIPTYGESGRTGTPETYLGWNRMEYLGSPETVRPVETSRYSSVKEPGINVFYFDGLWKVDGEWSAPAESGAKLIFRVKAGRIYLVARGNEAGIRARVTINGKPPADHGRLDGESSADGGWQVTFREGRMYTLADYGDDYSPKLLEMTFLEPGVELYAFSFG